MKSRYYFLRVSILIVVMFIQYALTAQNIRKIRIDPSQAFGGTVSEYFDNVEYIPLETTKESEFGDRERMIITDSSYVISDFDTRSVLFFNLKGKFITKKKFSQNKYINIYEDNTGGKIVVSIYDPCTQKVETEYYSLMGKALSKAKSSIATFTSPPVMVPLGNNYYAQAGNCYWRQREKPVDSIFYLINIYHHDSLIKSLIPYNQLKNAGLCALNGYIEVGQKANNGDLFAATPLEHIIYTINKDTAIAVYKLVLPLNRTIPDNILHSYNPEQIDSINRIPSANSNIVMNLSNIFFHKTWLFFRLNMQYYAFSGGSDSKAQYNIIYDTLSGKLISLERISSDASTCFLPVSDIGTSIHGLEYNDGFLYSTLSSLQMFTAKEKTQSKNPQYPPVLQEYFKTQNRKSNPVIVKMKLKE